MCCDGQDKNQKPETTQEEAPLDHVDHLCDLWWGQEEPKKDVSVTLLPSLQSPVA